LAAGAGVEALLAAARAVFTEAMPVLPRFAIANPTELAAALTAQAVADPTVVADRWLAGVAPVRENLAALTTMTALAAAFGRPTPTAVAVQLPDQPGEAW